MCGISGLVGIDSFETILRMVEVQTHRGPDDSGIEKLSENPPLYFGNNRLSIIDLTSRGHQPMFNEDRTLCIVYNGEVYNFQEIRQELIKRGYSFFSRTDTEVILKAYECWGVECLHRFNGMFAFAIHDKRKNKVILARDRLGIKPLYYWTNKDKFAFASEIKALLEVKAVRETIALDREAFVSYVSLLWTPDTKTPFTSIQRLTSGSFYELDLQTGKKEIKKYWKIGIQENKLPLEQAREKLHDLLSESVRRQMIADVKVGAFLSGGLDSSAITTLMAKNTSETIEAFTITFSEEDQKIEAMMDDFQYAKKLSDEYHFHLNKIEADARVSADLLPKIIYHLDEPIGDPAAINTYIMSRMAKESGVTILLSGQGSDEIFGGYRKYVACLLLEKYKKIAPSAFQQFINSIIKKIPVKTGGKGLRMARWAKRSLLDKPEDLFGIYFSLSNFIDAENLSTILSPEFFNNFSDRIHRNSFESAQGSYLSRMCYTDTELYLPGLNLNYSDKASMAASIECRVPFCDHEIVEYAFSLPDDFKIHNFSMKYILKKAFQGRLPHKIIRRPKMPFGSPIRSWVKKGFKELIDEYLSKERIQKQGLFNYQGIRQLIEEDRRGIQDNAHVIYGLLTIQIWLDVFHIL